VLGNSRDFRARAFRDPQSSIIHHQAVRAFNAKTPGRNGRDVGVRDVLLISGFELRTYLPSFGFLISDF
jgi:hypothetical protein